MKTDLTAGFGERFMTVTDRYCFAVYRKRLHVAINAFKFKVKFVGKPKKNDANLANVGDAFRHFIA